MLYDLNENRELYEEEWINRYIRALQSKGGMTASEAAEYALSIGYDNIIDEDLTPEEAAEIEVSYWPDYQGET